MNRPNDEQNSANPPAPASRGINFKLAAVALTLVSALFGTGLAYLLKPKPQVNSNPDAANDVFSRLFRGWDKPDLVLLLTAQQHGYMMPCGCSDPQLGGLERRYNLMQMFKAHGWPVVGVDLGDVPQKHGPAYLSNLQGLLKYRYSMLALKEMDYLGVGIGEYEGALSLARVEGEYATNNAKPAVLVGNLQDPDSFPFLKPLETRTIPGANIKVGVTNIIGRTVAKNFPDKSVKFSPSQPALDQMVKQMEAAKVELPVLLYHGVATGEKEALNCAKAYPQFPVILCLSEEDEPPSDPIPVDHPESKTRNYIFRLGHKGKYVGALGVFRNGKGGFDFKYKLVEMNPEFATPEGQKDDQPIVRMWEQYTRELKDKDYLQKYGRTKHLLQAMDAVQGLRNPGDGVPQYIGSEACNSCHKEAYAVWKETPHHHAYETLVKARHPSLRQYDAECIVCHTVGFGYQTGYGDEKAVIDPRTGKEKKPILRDVGCESCHGPGSLHAKNPENQQWRDRMNEPWRAARAAGNEEAKFKAIEKFCVSCHDIDNDVTWVHNHNKKDPFIEKWIGKKIIHNKPKDE